MTEKDQKRKEYLKAYYQANKDKMKEQQKAYADANKDKIKDYQKDYQKEYKGERDENYHKEYYEKNKNKINKLHKEYMKTLDKDKVKEYRKEYQKNRRLNDNVFRISQNVRNMIGKSIRNKGYSKLTKTELILGCSYDFFIKNIESLWEPWMNWDNYGTPKDGIYELNKTWDIDHIIPLDESITENDVLKLNHYTNLQPLCSYHNRWIKNNKNPTE
jgi:hypothetical protein